MDDNPFVPPRWWFLMIFSTNIDIRIITYLHKYYMRLVCNLHLLHKYMVFWQPNIYYLNKPQRNPQNLRGGMFARSFRISNLTFSAKVKSFSYSRTLAAAPPIMEVIPLVFYLFYSSFFPLFVSFDFRSWYQFLSRSCKTTWKRRIPRSRVFSTMKSRDKKNLLYWLRQRYVRPLFQF